MVLVVVSAAATVVVMAAASVVATAVAVAALTAKVALYALAPPLWRASVMH